MDHLLSGFNGVLTGGFWAAFIQIVLIDVTLASDNAVAVGMAASGLPGRQRHLAIILGLSVAVVLLCGLAVFAIALLKVGGGYLVAAGGVLLLLVAIQMWRDLQRNDHKHHEAAKPHEQKTLFRALSLIFVADISTSLDNVLAVAGVARGQPDWLLFGGLALSVALTGFAAVGVAKLLHRWPWIGYIGLVVVLYVSGHMMWDGAVAVKWIRI
jgi:YjbE family integral membrane protein